MVGTGGGTQGGAAIHCAALRGSGGELQPNRPGDAVNVHILNGKGQSWAHRLSMYTGFHAALAPNQPSCTARNAGTNDWGYNQDIIITASSNHPGGVNVALCDGAVRFVSNSVDAGDPSRRLGEAPTDPPGGRGDRAGFGHQWQGPSTKGIWGAMATPSGGESAGSL